MSLPTIIDIRLVRLASGNWRIRLGSVVHEVNAYNLPAFVHALVRDLVLPRHHGRSRWDVPEGGA